LDEETQAAMGTHPAPETERTAAKGTDANRDQASDLFRGAFLAVALAVAQELAAAGRALDTAAADLLDAGRVAEALRAQEKAAEAYRAAEKAAIRAL